MSSAENLTKKIAPFVPEESVDIIVRWIIDYKILLTITPGRRSVLGDYRWPTKGKGHRISVNGDLNKYSFLVTLVHEVAHLVTWEKYRFAVTDHGPEWKTAFKMLMDQFTGRKLFPGDVRMALKRYFINPSATHCADPVLIRVLNKYNAIPVLHLEELEANALFKVGGSRIFRKGRKLRKRYQCVELQSGNIYLFSPVAEVKRVKDINPIRGEIRSA